MRLSTPMKDYGYNQLNHSNLSVVHIHGSGFTQDAYNQKCNA